MSAVLAIAQGAHDDTGIIIVCVALTLGFWLGRKFKR